MPYKNIEQRREHQKEYCLKNKELKQEYDKERYQKNKEHLTKQVLEWRKNNKEKYEETAKKRRNSEKGYVAVLWQSIKAGNKHNSFRDFNDFYNHWLEQKKIYGMKCPATGVEMTMKVLFNEKGKFERCGTNISKDRILNHMGYSHQNVIFTCWNYNKAKGNFTTKMAKAYLRIVKERYGTDEME